MADEGSDEEWRFSVDEFDDPPRSEAATAPDSSIDGRPVDDVDAPGDPDESEDGEDASVAGEFSPAAPVEPELPELENAVFVTLGAIVTILVFAAVIAGPSFGVLDGLTISLVVGGLGALIYGVFVRLTPDT